MAFHDKLKAALIAEFGAKKVVFMPKWDVQRRCAWQGPGRVPNALLLHHTAAAATTLTSPKAAGNQRGANKNVITYIQTHYEVPAANFTLDRDGTVYVHSAYCVWHAGMGTFKGKAPWSSLGIPADQGNDYMLGVEIMSKGLKKDFTAAQEAGVGALLRASATASKWVAPKGPKALVRRPQHKDWTARKIDLQYTNAEVAAWLR